MTQQIINVGSAINDGTGDPARVAFTHCNENFTELYQVSRPTGNTIEYQFNNTTTEPPSTGQIRFNQATQASTTKIWANHTTSSGVNIKQFLAAATTGAKLVLQDKNDNTNYIKFDVTGVPVDKTTYWEFAVAVTASGGNLPNAAVLAAVTASSGGGAGTGTSTPPQGRLTLDPTFPVMTANVVNTTAIFYVPYVGDRCPIFDGTNLVMMPFGAQFQSTTDTTQNPSALGPSKVNDWFIWLRSGAVMLSHGPDWTSDTARSAGTALVRVNGIWLNNVTIGNGTTTGPAAQRGTYVGTTRSNASSNLDWILPGSAAGGTAGVLGVWNCYNRCIAGGTVMDTTASWAYASATIRQKNGSAGNQVAFVSGLQGDVASASVMQAATAGTDGNPAIIGIGIDSTTVFTSNGPSSALIANAFSSVSCSHCASSLGFHTWTAIEATLTAAGVLFYGTLSSPTRNANAMTFTYPM